MILYWLTLAAVALVVLVVAGYLVAIAAALLRARRNVARLADGFEAVAGHTRPLGAKIDAVGSALAAVHVDFAALDERFARLAGTLERA